MNFFFFNRIDGFLLNTTSNASSIEINNGTVLLDIQVRFSSEVEESSVLLMSLQYKSGILSLSFNQELVYCPNANISPSILFVAGNKRRPQS